MVERQLHDGRSRIKRLARGAIKKPKKGFGKAFAREAVVKLGPADLRTYLALNEAEQEVEDNQEQEQEESDLDDRDPDDPESEEEGGELYVNSYLATLGESFQFSGLPVLDLRNKYWLAVSEDSNGRPSCSFEEPTWFHRVEDPDVAIYMENLCSFLLALAQWFEEERSEYLANPIAENYTLLDKQYPADAVVVQKSLFARINVHIPTPKRLREQDFTKLMDNIWILWSRWNMSLRQVFSKEYKLEWVVQGCLQRYQDVGTWLEKAPKDMPNKDLARIKNKDFDSLSLEEMFRMLCATARVKTKPAFKMVGERIERLATNGR